MSEPRAYPYATHHWNAAAMVGRAIDTCLAMQTMPAEMTPNRAIEPSALARDTQIVAIMSSERA